MNYRLKTSKNTEEILLELKNKLGASITPNILSRLAVGLSLTKENLSKSIIIEELKDIDVNGLEFLRPTLIGENEIVFKVLMENYCNEHLTDSEFFPSHFKFHLERGVKLLKSEVEISNGVEGLIKQLLNV